MLLAAIVCAFVGLGLLAVAVQTGSMAYIVVMFGVVAIGVVFFAVDHWSKRK